MLWSTTGAARAVATENAAARLVLCEARADGGIRAVHGHGHAREPLRVRVHGLVNAHACGPCALRVDLGGPEPFTLFRAWLTGTGLQRSAPVSLYWQQPDAKGLRVCGPGAEAACAAPARCGRYVLLLNQNADSPRSLIWRPPSPGNSHTLVLFQRRNGARYAGPYLHLSIERAA
jgi:hypothetical protein